MHLLLDGKNEYSSYKMWDGSDIIFPDRFSNIFVCTTWKLGSGLSCKPIYRLIYVIYMCGTEGDTVNHRVCWPNHTSKHMLHSIQRRMLENMTKMTILVFIAAVQAADQMRVINAAGIKAQWLLLCIRTASVPLVWNGRKAAWIIEMKPNSQCCLDDYQIACKSWIK